MTGAPGPSEYGATRVVAGPAKRQAHEGLLLSSGVEWGLLPVPLLLVGAGLSHLDDAVGSGRSLWDVASLAFGAVAVAVLVEIFLEARTPRAWLHAQGLAWRRGRKWREISWDQVTAVYATSTTPGGGTFAGKRVAFRDVHGVERWLPLRYGWFSDRRYRRHVTLVQQAWKAHQP